MDEFTQNSKLTLKLLKNVIKQNKYKTKEDVLDVIDLLIDEPEPITEPKLDWYAMIRDYNALRLRIYRSRHQID